MNKQLLYQNKKISYRVIGKGKPVVLVHGWGGSFESTWQRSGFTELLADAGREVIGVDLLGHGNAPKPHDPEAYDDLTARVVDVLPDEPVAKPRCRKTVRSTTGSGEFNSATMKATSAATASTVSVTMSADENQSSS